MKKLILAAAIAGFATASFAQMSPMLGPLDKDSSGNLSPEEIKGEGGMPTMTDEDFKKFDIDGDGSMNQDEYTKMIEMVGK